MNLPIDAGVQIELPPSIRWNDDEKTWSDHEGAGRASQVDELIGALTSGVTTWHSQRAQ